jgi:DNA polymerase-3 subunit gamma/tau
MMSGSAFNALLKTLEEPPSYVVFILATTEFNKLPTTIVSRCQRFDFRRMTTDVIVERLRKISDAEGIDLGDDGAAVIARAAEGGMRDAVSLLELCAGSRKRIDAELVFETVGRGNRSSIYDLIEKVLDKNYSAVYSAIADVVTVGSDLTVFWQELLDAYRDIMVVKNTSGSKEYLDLTDTEHERLTKLASVFTMSKLLYHTSVLEESLADLQRAKESKRSVAEIALTRMCDAKLSSGAEALLERIEELEQTVSRLKFGIGTQPKSKEQDVQQVKAAEPVTEKVETVKPAEQKPQPMASTVSYSKWGAVLTQISEAKPAMHPFASKAVALKRADGSFLIKFDAFYAKQFEKNPENMMLLRGIIAEIEGIDAGSLRVDIGVKEAGEVATLADEIENNLR